MLLLCAMVFAACGGNAVIGKWKPDRVETEGMSVTFEEFTKMIGVQLDVEFEFMSDGKVVATIMNESTEGTYMVDGSKVELALDGETQTLELKNKTLTFISDEIKFTLVKK